MTMKLKTTRKGMMRDVHCCGEIQIVATWFKIEGHRGNQTQLSNQVLISFFLTKRERWVMLAINQNSKDRKKECSLQRK